MVSWGCGSGGVLVEVMTAGRFRSDDHDNPEDRQDQVREELVAVQDIQAGDDEAVEEVEERAEEGLDGQVVDGAADALEDHDDPQQLNGFAHDPTLATSRWRRIGHRDVPPRPRSLLPSGTVDEGTGRHDFGIVAARSGQTLLPGR